MAINPTNVAANNFQEKVYATNSRCVDFLDEIKKSPELGVNIKQLALCSDRFGDVSGILTDNDLKTIVTQCPNITHLELLRCLSLTDKGLRKIAKLAHLRYLSISCCNQASDDFMVSLKGKPLIKLNVHNCYKITEIGFAVIPTLKNLEVLSLENCTGFNDTDLEKFSQLKLRSLNLGGCKKLTDKGLQTIFKMQNLKNCCLGYSEKTSFSMKRKIESSFNMDYPEFLCIDWFPAEHEGSVKNEETEISD